MTGSQTLDPPLKNDTGQPLDAVNATENLLRNPYTRRGLPIGGRKKAAIVARSASTVA